MWIRSVSNQITHTLKQSCYKISAEMSELVDSHFELFVFSARGICVLDVIMISTRHLGSFESAPELI